jgi:hypothetical protein
MNAKHTPGEWKAYYPADAQPGDACEDAAVIASEYGMIAVTVDDVGDESQQNANARLISAAPASSKRARTTSMGARMLASAKLK